jgi:hypothetical protein
VRFHPTVFDAIGAVGAPRFAWPPRSRWKAEEFEDDAIIAADVVCSARGEMLQRFSRFSADYDRFCGANRLEGPTSCRFSFDALFAGR